MRFISWNFGEAILTSTYINPLSVIPKFHQLYNIFIQKINSGDWSAKQLIPPERELEHIYHVSRTTVRRTLDLMVQQGYLFREQGRGTFVSPPKLIHNINLLKGFSESMLSSGLKPGQKILYLCYVKPPPKVCEQLELSPTNHNILNIKRLRLLDDEQIGIQNTYLNIPRDKLITEHELEERGSLYALLKEKYGLIPTEAVETLQARIADKQEAALLKIKAGSPLLSIERTVWSQYHNLLEYLEASYRGDRYKYYGRQSLNVPTSI